MVNAPALLLISLCTLALIGGCSNNRQPQSAPELTAADNEGGPWFCQPAVAAEEWDCDNDPARVANPVPDRKPQLEPPPALIDDALPASDEQARDQEPVALATLDVPAADERATPAASPASDAPDYQRLAYQPPTPMSLLELPANYYAVQLTAMRSAAQLEGFFNDLEVEGLTAAQVDRDGELFYILLLGVYENFASAEQASTDLPAPLDQFDPWIRRLGTLQAAMIRAEQRLKDS